MHGSKTRSVQRAARRAAPRRTHRTRARHDHVQDLRHRGSAVSAQSQRLNVVASNLANADTVAGPDGQAYKARQVVFQT
jgi:hypothetical protein